MLIENKKLLLTTVLLCFFSCCNAENEKELVIKTHNYYRRLHGCTDIHSGSKRIHEQAEKWADHLAQRYDIFHSHVPGYGENLYMLRLTKNEPVSNIGKISVDAFYNEIDFYPGYYVEEPREDVGHFTQVIWNASTRIGIGVRERYEVGRGKVVIVVCNYEPPGNVHGFDDKETAAIYDKQVPPPEGGWHPGNIYITFSLCTLLIVGIIIIIFLYNQP